MTDPHLPIHDSQVATFYFFQEPATKLPLQQRLTQLLAFHNFLKTEYDRVLKQGLLAISIQELRRHLQPRHFTDEKVIDSLIWAFVGFMNKNAVLKGQIIYS